METDGDRGLLRHEVKGENDKEVRGLIKRRESGKVRTATRKCGTKWGAQASQYEERIKEV